jgi:rfaE bifunctional protein nucleotidyltransferase chain/domain
MQRAAALIFDDANVLRAHLDAVEASTVVLANGCFDPLHVGHVRYLQGARALGDFLVVAINNDAGTRRLKGEGRPVVGETERAAVLAALSCVDAVLVFGADDVGELLAVLHPSVHAKGTDYTEASVPEAAVARRLGVRTVITGDPKQHASREIVARVRRVPGS